VRATGVLLVLPYVVLLSAFGLGPSVYAAYESFVDERSGSRRVGLGNYAHVLGDFRFWPAVENVGTFLAIWLPVMVVGSLAFALLLHERIGRLSRAMRLLYFLPGAVTGSAAVLLWYCMLEPNLSPFGPALRAMGYSDEADVFTQGHLPWVFAVVAFATGAGTWIVIMFGALQGIPQDLLEAARVDGAGPIRSALLIKVPLVRRYLVYMVVLSFAAALQIFVEPQLFNSVSRNIGSPYWSLNQLGYAFAFQQGDFGSAAVISVGLLVISTAAALLVILRTDFFQTES
jgi:multiple sugar transport system permease protein